MADETIANTLPVLPHTSAEIIDAALAVDRRVLITGAPGTGKSTLGAALAQKLAQTGRDCWCIGADPGSPAFGIPGAVCLGRWDDGDWALGGIEALCTLDAGRFRLPLVAAVRRLARDLAPGMLLVDGPGVVRGVAGAELLSGIVEAARIDVVLVLVREHRAPPLEHELHALSADVFAVRAAAEARRPGKRVRARERTALWDRYLGQGTTHVLEPKGLHAIGTPPPLDVPAAWQGRQIALLQGERTTAMGEIVRADEQALEAKLPATPETIDTVLVRDAQRLEDGRLGTAARYAAERLEYYPPPDIEPRAPAGQTGGLRVVGRVGGLSVALVNGVFGDPLLHIRLRHERRSLLFDLGEGTRLPARVAHQVSDVFISHAHIDHIGGFLWLLRSRIGEPGVCRIYGPPGLADNIEGLTRGILWDRVEDRGPRFEVAELHGQRLLRFSIQAGRPGCHPLEERAAPDGLLLEEPAFRVRATTLEHVSPVLAFALEPAQQINIRKDQLVARGLSPGPWLGELKRHLRAGRPDARVALPDGRMETAHTLAEDLVLIAPGKKLSYATDLADTDANRGRLVALARGSHTFFCEASFLEEDAELAALTAHLTTRACAEIAEQAGVARLVPFHFSRRYEKDSEPLYEEIAAVCPRVVVPR